jgi:hypothetical protein
MVKVVHDFAHVTKAAYVVSECRLRLPSSSSHRFSTQRSSARRMKIFSIRFDGRKAPSGDGYKLNLQHWSSHGDCVA